MEHCAFILTLKLCAASSGYHTNMYSKYANHFEPLFRELGQLWTQITQTHTNCFLLLPSHLFRTSSSLDIGTRRGVGR